MGFRIEVYERTEMEERGESGAEQIKEGGNMRMSEAKDYRKQKIEKIP